MAGLSWGKQPAPRQKSDSMAQMLRQKKPQKGRELTNAEILRAVGDAIALGYDRNLYRTKVEKLRPVLEHYLDARRFDYEKVLSIVRAILPVFYGSWKSKSDFDSDMALGRNCILKAADFMIIALPESFSTN